MVTKYYTTNTSLISVAGSKGSITIDGNYNEAIDTIRNNWSTLVDYQDRKKV
jgi:hypothetical protein